MNINRNILSPLALSALLSVTLVSCGGDDDPVMPESTARVAGRIVLFPVNGAPSDNAGARVTIEGQPGLEAVSDANGDFRLENIRPTTADVIVSKTGYGTWREIDKKIEGNNGYTYGGIHLGEIPRATVTSITATIASSTSGQAVRFSGSVSEVGLDVRGQRVVLFLGVSDTVSNDPHSQSVRAFIDVDPGARTFSYDIPVSYFLSIGLAQGMRLHGVAHVMDSQTCTRFPVPGLALDWLTSLSGPPQRLSFVIP